MVGIPPHTDTLGLTLLLQVDDTPGLQVKRGGRWFPVRPLPGALVVNVGDALDVLTNGAYASVEHRVVPDARGRRVTVATFHEACVDGRVAPLPELLRGGEVPARYKSIGKLEYTKRSAEALAQGRRFLDSLNLKAQLMLIQVQCTSHFPYNKTYPGGTNSNQLELGYNL